jgi:1-deoxy-D-xylulose-5-phosphate synthase
LFIRKLLTAYDFPSELKSMDLREMELLSTQIREFLIDSISKTGGHLASNLGVVELGIALHRIFDSPRDKIVWDVGHQSYVHKILTGRADRFESLRKSGGLSGFPKREESPHDSFNTGHSSNSISAATGYAEARELSGQDYDVVAVIGDGALTGGLSYEALNNAGSRKTRLIVVLNDNEMSISGNIGAIAHHLSKLRASQKYLNLKNYLKRILRNIPAVGDGIYSSMEHIRDTLKFITFHSGAIFEELGFKYFGPVDGHNLREVLDVLSIARLIDQPVLVHVITTKGKGYRNAESNPGKFHGVVPFDPATGRLLQSGGARNATQVFGGKIVELAEKDPRIVAITAAMTDGSGLTAFAKRFPERFYDVGIAEAHAVTFAAGLACGGMKPFVCIYSTFLQRAYDQVLEDVCMQNLPVVFCVDRAGNVGADGETHHGLFDLSYLSHMPGMSVLAPADDRELTDMLEFAAKTPGPMAIRYPRGAFLQLLPPQLRSLGKPEAEEAGGIVHGKSRRLREGGGLDIWAVGKMTAVGLAVCDILEKQGIRPGLVSARFVNPLDEAGLLSAAARYKKILTLEDNVRRGGFGEAAAAFLSGHGGSDAAVKIIAWPGCFVEHGGVAVLMEQYGMDASSIAEEAVSFVGEEPCERKKSCESEKGTA